VGGNKKEDHTVC